MCKNVGKSVRIQGSVLEYREVCMKRDVSEEHGQRVVKRLGGEEELHQFQLMWREHFIEKMKPRFMPDDWHDWKE